MQSPKRGRSASRRRLGTAIRSAVGPFGGQPASEKVISATVYTTQLSWPRGNLNFFKIPDLDPMEVLAFKTMTPPRTAPGTGGNTLQQLGVYQAQASSTATLLDPFQRNFWGIKIDHPGWNACNVTQWDANITQFAYVKTSGVVCEISLPDAPITRSEATKIIRPTVMTNAQLAAVQTQQFGLANSGTPIWNEQRPSGAWQYIIIPAHKAASINLSKCVGRTQWQQIIQLGYKPKTCKGNKYRISSGIGGFNCNGIKETGERLSVLQSGSGVIPASNLAGVGFALVGEQATHKRQESDWCVQFGNNSQIADSFAGARVQLDNFTAQGFDVLAYGSAIVFQFCQYAPPTVEGVITAELQVLPVTLTIHNKTVFSTLKTTSNDLGQVYSLPVVGGV